MSNQTEEVRTKFIWDTSDADAGAKRMEKAMERLTDAEKKAQRESKKHGGDSNFAMGIRDMAEGRGVNAMQRFGHTLGATAGRLAAYMLAAKAAGSVISYLRDEMEKTDASSRRLEGEFSAKSRLGITASSAQKPGTLTASIGAMNEGAEKENEQQVDAQRAADLMEKMRSNPISAAVEKAMYLVREFQGKRSPEQEAEASKKRGEFYAAEGGKLRELRGESYAHEADIAREQGPGGNPFEAKRKELEIQQKLEESEARIAGLSDKEKQSIKDRYSYMRQMVSAEESLVSIRREFRGAQIATQGGSQSSFQKGLAMSSLRIRESTSLRNSGLLNEQQRADELVNIQQAESGRLQQIRGRYLNSDGSRRRARDINRDFRNDRRETRLRARFDRAYEQGLIDPETGRRRVGGDTPGSGLTSGGLKTSGLRSGGLGYTSWKDSFTPPEKSAATGGSSTSKTTGDLYTLLDQRLPNQTA